MAFFRKLFIAVLVIGSMSTHLTAATSQFEAGKDYQVVAPATTTEPLVEEFFNYACGACYGTESFVEKLKADNPGLTVKPVPVELRPAWKIYVKAYYLGEKLGVLDKSHAKIYHRIHVQKKYFKDESDLKAFFLSLGVAEKAYDDVANSYWINTQMRLSKQYAFKNQVTGTPTFLVNKRFKLNRAAIGTLERMEAAIQELSGLKTEVPAN